MELRYKSHDYTTSAFLSHVSNIRMKYSNLAQKIKGALGNCFLSDIGQFVAVGIGVTASVATGDSSQDIQSAIC
jgi:hypothetical protein